MDNVRVDVGGDAWTTANENMMQLMKELPIEVWNDNFSGNGLTAVFDGKTLFPASKFEPILELEVAVLLERFKLHLRENYRAFEQSSFSRIEDYLSKGGLASFLKESSRSYANRLAFGSFFAQFQWEPLTRTIYDQSLDLTLFAGVVSLLSTERSYTCLRGNDWIVKELAKRSKAKILVNTTVGSISNSSIFDLEGNLISQCR
jgi:hypothetical protein